MEQYIKHYHMVLRTVGPVFVGDGKSLDKKEYIFRFSEELKRGKALGELKKDVFSETAWNNIESIIEDPERYYFTRVYPVSMNQKVFECMEELSTENQKLRNEISRIRGSLSFRIGRAVMYFPGKIKKRLGGRRK